MTGTRGARRTAAVAVCALTIGAPAANGATLPLGSAPYGLVASSANFVPGKTLAERTANYRRLFDAGVRAVRLDVNWVAVDPIGPPKGVYDFTALDREVRAISDAGLKVIAILDYGHPDYSRLGSIVAQTPIGAGVPPFYLANAQYFPPDDPADFARYARATAEHYRGKVVAWEVWNEENEGYRFWAPHEDPAAYGRLLCATYPRLKAADPGTPVLYGGLFFPAVADAPGMSAPDFVDAGYAADPQLGRCYDAMAYHPYPYPFTAPELEVPIRGSVLSAADQMRAVLARHGDADRPLWITEVGWPTHDRTYGVPETKQAQYLARMYLASFAQGLPAVTWYTYGDYADPTGANQEAWFGLFRPDNSAKPAYRALRTLTTTFAGTRFVADRSRALGLPAGAPNVGGRGFALQYRRRGLTVTALWLASESAVEGQSRAPSGGTAGPASINVRLSVNAPSVRVVDYLGAWRTVAARRGAVVLTVGPGPRYVVDAGRARRRSLSFTVR